MMAAMLAVYEATMTREKPQRAATVNRPAADRGSAAVVTEDDELVVAGVYRVINIIVVSAQTALCARPRRGVATGKLSSSASAGDDEYDEAPSRRSTCDFTIMTSLQW